MAYYLTSVDVLYPIIPQADLTELFDDNQNGSIDVTVYDALVKHVESLFHSYISRRYTIPLVTAGFPTTLAVAQLYCARLFEYYAYGRRKAVTPEIKARYDSTVAELEKIRDGKLGINDPPPTESTSTACHYTATYTDRDYTATTMSAWGGGASRDD